MGKKVLLITAFAAFAAFVISGAPAVAHDAVIHPDGTTLHRDCTWTVDKRADDTSLLLSVGQSATVNYTIVLSARCTDALHDEHGNHTPVTGHEGETPDHGTNLCVTIADAFAPAGTFGDGQVCVGELTNGSITFHYSRDFGPFRECGDLPSHTNTVIVTDHAGTELARDSVTVTIHVACPPVGCTLTQGYWKTHSIRGPAPFDDNWNNIPTPPYAPSDGDATDENESETFFLSGQTWYQVFWTAPAGNAYYILAHQYMAAVLNILNGASAPAGVTAALNTALGLFQTKTPAQIGALKGSDSLRQQFISLAGTLGQYNEGNAPGGPPHCDEH